MEDIERTGDERKDPSRLDVFTRALIVSDKPGDAGGVRVGDVDKRCGDKDNRDDCEERGDFEVDCDEFEDV